MVLLLLLGCPNDQKLGVYDALPTATLASPVDGQTFPAHTAIAFEGEVHDQETDLADLGVSLSSNLDGVVVPSLVPSADGAIDYPVASLSVGTHTITLAVVDDIGQQAVANVTLTIEAVPDAPEVAVVHPVLGETGRDDAPFTFVGQLADATDALDTLTFTVTAEDVGEVCTAPADAAGVAACAGNLPPGTAYLTFTATDPGGLTGTAEAGLVVASHLDLDDDADGWTENQGDCDDARDSVHPGATETFDDVDEDCDGVVDNGTTNHDDDGDGLAEVDGDCDDADASSFPGGVEVIDGADNDCDGLVDDQTSIWDDDADGYAETDGDCDDGDPSAYPGAPENLSDSVDQDCDGVAQQDADGDGAISLATGGDDCDDTDDATFPGAAYAEADPTICATDADGDGFGDDVPVSGVDAGSDCDDGNPAVNPDVSEDASNYVDEDCDGTAQLDLDVDGYVSIGTGGDDCDDHDASTHPNLAYNETNPALCYTDTDGDGFGDDAPTGTVTAGSDCDDGDSGINPDATETCDSADNDCDGSVDEENATGCTTYYYDYDGDAYGSKTTAGKCLCAPTGYYTSSYKTDCYDNNASANPSATSYYTTDRGDGDYDYNCNSVEDKKYPDLGDCSGWPLCTLSSGWKSSVRSCGTTGTYYTGCSLDWTSCSSTVTSRTQSCR